MIDKIIERVGCYAWPAIAFVAGLIAKHIFDIYANKISRLQYSISKSFLGASGHDNYFGKVQVLHNDRPVENLYLCNLTLVNTSNKDFKDIEITVWCDTNSIILVSSAFKSGTINPLLLTDKYIQECQNINEQNLALVWSRRPYRIPVLNRDDNVVFSCLVTGIAKTQPNIYLDCEHPGLKVEANFIQPEYFWGENKNLGALYGLFISAIVSIFVVYYLQSKVLIAVIVFLLGALCLLPGVIALKISKKIRKIIR
ncbi:MAG TPA: hypothetical protein PK263_05455 [bacterium]|nr:hypothetical protein [bacterium]